MSTENTKADTPAVDNTATTTTTTEQVAESPVAATADATPDAPTTTTSDEAKDGEDTTGAATAAEDTTEEAASAAVKSEEAKEEPTKPTPSPSRSGTKRLSMFLSKAKKSLVPEKDEKKSTSHPATTSAETKALPEDPKPVTKEESQEQDAPAADETTEPAPASEAEPVASTSDDKQEKRKSKFLNGFFKKVTTPTKEEKEREIKTDDKPEAAKEETNGKALSSTCIYITLKLTSLVPVLTVPEETPVTEESANAPAAEETAPEEPVVAETSAPAVPPKDTAPKNKETNVVDQIKRHSLVSKWFGKKEKATSPTHEEAPSASATSDTAPVIPEPAATEPITTDDTPAPAEELSNDVTEAPKEEAPKAEEEETTVDAPKEETAVKQPSQEKPSRSGSPLGRRLTQILRGFPKKDKKDKKEKAPAEKEEEPKAPKEEEEPVEETAAKEEAHTSEDHQNEPKAEAPAVTTPTVQATA